MVHKKCPAYLSGAFYVKLIVMLSQGGLRGAFFYFAPVVATAFVRRDILLDALFL